MGLTKLQRLEVENCTLRSRLDKIKKAIAEYEMSTKKNRYNSAAWIECEAKIEVAVDFEDYLQKELEWAEHLLEEYPDYDWKEFLKRRTPGTNQEPGAKTKTNTTPVYHGEKGKTS